CLEPIGVGTPYIESLTSYITRLAIAHSVSMPNLIIFLFEGDKDGHEGNEYNHFNRKFNPQIRSLNGSGSIPEKWVVTLQEATSCNQLPFLTMLTWKNVITNEKLLRQRKAWCPQCYDEWKKNRQVIYEPLIWMLEAVTVCGKHH